MGELNRTHYRIRVPEKPGPMRPFSLAVLADLHNRPYCVRTEVLLQAVLKEKVSAVLSAGDLVLAKGGFSRYDEALRLLTALTKELPVYLVNGNHETRMRGRRYAEDYRLYQSALEDLGVISLNNRCTHVRFEGMPVGIYGLEIPESSYKGKTLITENTLSQTFGALPASEYAILLAHHPKFFEAYAKWGADLTLAGHLHGGIVRLPGVGGVISPDFALFPPYDGGMFYRNGKRMVVSRGLGTHTIPVRFNNPAELVILEFVPKERYGD